MKIKTISNQHRRDFNATYKCEFCGHEEKGYGYDDRNFHDNVIPNMKCEKCKKSTVSEGGNAEETPTKYPEGFQV